MTTFRDNQKMKTEDIFLYSLLEINEEIKKQIPLASNYYEQFERLATPEKLSAEEIKFHEAAVDERFKKHSNELLVEKNKYLIYQYINTEFKKFLEAEKIIELQLMTEEHKKKFIAQVKRYSKRFFNHLETVQKMSSLFQDLDILNLKIYFSDTVDLLVEKVCQGDMLFLEDKDFENRLKNTDLLKEYRAIAEEQVFVNSPQLLSSERLSSSEYQKLKKANYFSYGVFLDRAQINVGQCNEFMCLGLKKIFQRFLVREKAEVEVITIDYKNGTGHTFLAINRDPGSVLNNIPSWGDQAYLFDAWNDLVCRASDFDKLPYYYFTYSANARWKIDVTYDAADRLLLENLTYIDECLYITGNTEEVKRAALLLEEYELISLNNEALDHTRNYLSQIVQHSLPPEFNYSVELFLTTAGNQAISVINGFSEPKIAVHLDLFNEENSFSHDDLAFGILRTLLFIKHYPLANEDSINRSDHLHIDRLALEQFKNGPQAINYLRQCLQFEKTRDKSVELINLAGRCSSGMGYQHRIKNLNNLLALDVSFRGTTLAHSIPDLIRMEIRKAKLRKEILFEKGFNKYKSKHQQLNYLTTQLEELKIELLPFELTKKPSRRLKDFCFLLTAIKSDLDDPKQAKAVDKLINKAFNLRIAGFDYLYRSVVNDHNAIRASLPALGPFKKLQKAITAFVSARNDTKMKHAASKVNAWEERLNDHFQNILLNQTTPESYIKNYKEKHQNNLPQGDDRYFGSTIARCVVWTGFPKRTFNTPWSEHLKAAKKDPTNLVAKTLWRLGIREEELWPRFGINELLQMINSHASDYRPPLVELHEFCDYQIQKGVLNFCSKNHQLNISMFESSLTSFEERFIQFFDNNLPALISPRKNFNDDNLAVNFLLRQFYRIAIGENEADKQVVKSFFLGRDDKRDLRHLLTALLERSALDYNMPYTRFVKDQEFEKNAFQLFTNVDLFRFLNYIDPYWKDKPASPEWYISLFSLPHEALDLSCLKELIPLIRKQRAFYSLMPEIVQNHLVQYGPYPLFSHEAAVIAQIVAENFLGPYESSTRKLILNSLTRPKSLMIDDLKSMTAEDLITIYRSCDINFLFPSILEQEELANLVIQKIEMITSPVQKMQLVEALLFVSDAFPFPIMDLKLRNTAIDLWLGDALTLFGKDDNSEKYYENLKQVIDHLEKGLSHRDLGYLLNLLANAIMSQKNLSHSIGILLEPDKYNVLIDKKNYSNDAIDALSKLSGYLGQDKRDQKKFLDFLSSPLTALSRQQFASHLYYHCDTKKIVKCLGHAQGFNKLDLSGCEQLTQLTYNMFWNCSLEQRALIINYLLLPPDTVVDEKTNSQAYHEAFLYVSNKLFPDAGQINSDDNIAVAFLKSYLEVADEYTRGYLLAALLVTRCESEDPDQKSSIGKKIAILCEHMGPAYVKLAQAIHSHPQTPENIRQDLSHLKGRANPPTRWHLWRIMDEVLPMKELNQISYLGSLLGSASYNFALQIERLSGEKLVLLLLRENAEKNSKQGFAHLHSAIGHCQHEKVDAYRSVFLSMLDEASELSALEINHDCGDRQHKIAANMYHLTMNAEIESVRYQCNIFPAKSLCSGDGYRFIEEVHGREFNDLPSDTAYEKAVCKSVAQAILTIELINILSAGHFDCDRHGNQLRVLVDQQNHLIQVGLYDFGEMSLDKPSIQETQHLKNLIQDFLSAFLKGHSFDQIISNHIEKVLETGENPRYLMRLRKAFLALQDFQKYLTPPDLLNLFKEVSKSDRLSPILASELRKSVSWGTILYSGSSTIKNAFNQLAFFRSAASTVIRRSPGFPASDPMEETPREDYQGKP